LPNPDFARFVRFLNLAAVENVLELQSLRMGAPQCSVAASRSLLSRNSHSPLEPLADVWNTMAGFL
jgi:hypothetical protein